MEMKKLINISAALLALAGFQSCQNDFDDPGLRVPEATLKANKTIAELKKAYSGVNAYNLTPEDNCIIRGRVVSSDATGNIYQTLVIQDETAALPVTIRRASLYNEYHLGQEVVVNTSGLWIGKYNGLIQLGWLGEPYNGEDQLTFMSFAEFSTHSQLNGVPAPETSYLMPDASRPTDNIYCLIENIDKLPVSGEDMYNLQGQLVEFRNVSFDDGGVLTYAPYQETVNRYIRQEGNSLKLTVRNSGYSTFYNDLLPAGKGTVRGILSWYGDGSSSTTGVIGGWQLLLRSTEDVIFDTKGTHEEPYTVEEALASQNDGVSGWVKGYIVGAVKGGVATVTSSDQIDFSADVEMDNNLVIAGEPDCKDWSRCVAVILPQGSDFRKYGNLADNPAVYRKSIVLRGDLSDVLGMAGISGNAGTAADFEIDGVKLPGGDGPVNPGTVGSGTENDPYSVAGVVAGSASGSDKWVKGYIVGFISGMTLSTGAIFSNNTEGTEYTNTNILLADTPDCKDVSACIPVQLPSGNMRTELGLGNNPSAYGKQIEICGSIERYFGANGLKSPTQFKWSNGGGNDTPGDDGPDDPAGEGNGSAESPFDVAGVISGHATGSGVWVEGVVVGYVSGMSYSGATFSTSDATDNYLLLASDGDCKDAAKCIPVNVPSALRGEIGLKSNPGLYKQTLRIKGDISKVLNQNGVTKLTEYEIK